MNLSVIIALFAFIVAGAACIYVLYKNRSGMRRMFQRFNLSRHVKNPIISPTPTREWEASGTFNPAAVEDDNGKVHLFYRAIGADGLSRVSHAVSPDGYGIDEFSSYPVYEPLPGYGMPEPSLSNMPHRHDPLAHPSGGGWGGSEDPRTTRIGDRVYMTYTAFEGWDNMRIGLTSISLDDLKKRRWNWRRPRLISPPKTRNKNWVLFPEKINGKYAILHSVAPKVLVAYLDSLDMVPVIKSSADHGGYGIYEKDREHYWDKVMKGAGPPPIKTDIGWLVLYHAINKGGYNVGAMILDLHDPTKILYRSPQPILTPDMGYENDGKPGIVYATGAVVKDNRLLVYYGGGDRHVCIAETPLNSLLDWLVNYGKV